MYINSSAINWKYCDLNFNVSTVIKFLGTQKKHSLLNR